MSNQGSKPMLKTLNFGEISQRKVDRSHSGESGGSSASSSTAAIAGDLTSPQLEIIRSQSAGKLKFSPEAVFKFTAEDLDDLGVIGEGAFGTVNKMRHRNSNTVMAVKRIRSTVDEKEQKQLLMDLDVIMRSERCPCIVQFYGAIFKEVEGDCWICMELMDISLEKLYKLVYRREERLPEPIIGKVALATVTALNYLKGTLKIIHRDVKPSNILLDRQGKFPYPAWKSVFDQLQQVVHGDPPILLPNEGYSIDLVSFVNCCLVKDEAQRPKYDALLEMKFITKYENEHVDVAGYVANILSQQNWVTFDR